MTDKEHAFNLAYTVSRLLSKYGDANAQQRIDLQVNAARAVAAWRRDQPRDLL
jgi:hypothetical protein